MKIWSPNHWKESESRSVMSNSLQPHGLYSPWNSPGQNTGVGNFSLLQGIFPTQGSNLAVPHCRQMLYQLSHRGSPRILEWVAYPFSRGSSWHSWGRSSFLPAELWGKPYMVSLWCLCKNTATSRFMEKTFLRLTNKQILLVCFLVNW